MARIQPRAGAQSVSDAWFEMGAASSVGSTGSSPGDSGTDVSAAWVAGPVMVFDGPAASGCPIGGLPSVPVDGLAASMPDLVR